MKSPCPHVSASTETCPSSHEAIRYRPRPASDSSIAGRIRISRMAAPAGNPLRAMTLAAWQQSRQTTTVGAAIASIQHRQVRHEDSPGYEILRIRVIGEQITFLAPPDGVDRPVSGEVDHGDLGPPGLFGQPLGEVLGDGVAACV